MGFSEGPGPGPESKNELVLILVIIILVLLFIIAVQFIDIEDAESLVLSSPIERSAPTPKVWVPEPLPMPEPEYLSYLPLVLRAPLVSNPGFEKGTWAATAWCRWPCSSVSHTHFNEVRPGYKWVAWWIQQKPSVQSTPTGRPEVKLINRTVDSKRVHSGDKALHWFTFWRPHFGGIAQRTGNVTLYLLSSATHGLKHADLYVDDVSLYHHMDGSITVRLWMHAWYSECDARPYDLPYLADCVTLASQAHMYLTAGIDFAGRSVSPRLALDGVKWGSPVEVYGLYTEWPLVFTVQAND